VTGDVRRFVSITVLTNGKVQFVTNGGESFYGGAAAVDMPIDEAKKLIEDVLEDITKWKLAN
jgi:hypothetical protein